MLRKCANSSCGQEFRYRQSGKAFRVESRQVDATDGDKTCVTVEYYWLCDACLFLVLPLLNEHIDRQFCVPTLGMTRSVRLVRVDEAMREEAPAPPPLELAPASVP